MKIVLSPNPYRDRGLETALEAKRILEASGAEVSVCLPFEADEATQAEISGKVKLKRLSRELERDEDEKTIRQAVAGLCERERIIIEMRYGLSGRREMTQKEVADVLGISQSYISRLEKKIISRLKKEIETMV